MTTADQAVAELAHRLRSRVDFPMKLGSSLVIPGGCGGFLTYGGNRARASGTWQAYGDVGGGGTKVLAVPPVYRRLRAWPTPGMAVWIGLWLEIQKEMRMQYENCSCLLSGTGNTEAMAQAVAEGQRMPAAMCRC